MKKINLIFYGLGFKNFFQANIRVFDQCNNIVFSGTTYNGKLELCLRKNMAYRLYAESCGEFINTAFYVKDDYCNYKFYFSRAIPVNDEEPITLLLTDYYYNLPIEKGEIIFG